MAWKRKAAALEEEVADENEDRFFGCVVEKKGDRMWVSCEGLPPEHEDMPPKITKKSQAPPGLDVGSWITFDLLDEWPGENWGSLLCVNIEEAEAPEGAEVPLPAKRKNQAKTPAGKPAVRPAAKPKANSSLTSAAQRLRAAVAQQKQQKTSNGAAGLAKRQLQSEPAEEGGLSKSGAVAAFRQARQQGMGFSAGWKSPAPGLSGRARAAVGKQRGKVVQELEPFQRAFLEPPEELDEASVTNMHSQREEMEVSVEMPEGLEDVFPPLEAFEDLTGVLPDYAMEGLAGMGIESPMPIQAQALPLVLAGLDIVGIAKTGSGKTLAYLLPALPHIEAQAPCSKNNASPVALILAPTRELAVQISDMAKAVTQASKPSSNHPGGIGAAVLYGGGSGSKSWQVAEVRKAGHIVAATPGRLIDVVDTGEVSLDRVTYLVLDEADRMLECGFEDQVGRIANTVREDRQMLFFSATWPTEVQELAALMCSSKTPPARVMVGQRADGDGPTSREDIVQEVVVFDQPTWDERDAEKQELLYAHLREVLAVEEHKVLVFVSRKDLADELAKRLWGEGFQTNAMHGGKAQESRLATLEEFRSGETKLLVTTDVMGRGLDIPGISHVVIFDMGDIEDYVHRIGRTARGPYGQGHALTFFEYDKKWPDLARQLAEVLEESGQEVPPELHELAMGTVQRAGKGGWR